MARNCIGLDIGSSAIKIVQLKTTKRGVQLVNFGIEPVPPQSIVDGSVMNSSAVIRRRIGISYPAMSGVEWVYTG